MTAAITLLYRHHRWANLALIDHLAGLPTPTEDLQRHAPGGFGSIHETLFHFVTNEGRFIETLRNVQVTFGAIPNVLPTCEELRATAAANGDMLIAIAGEITPESRVAGTIGGRRYDMPAFIPLFQAYHHGVEHRTYITTILAACDMAVPNLDLWSYQSAGMP